MEEVYISGKEDECADLYVNYNLYSSWERLARSLYRHHQVAAVEKVRSYLPPRGEPHLKCTIITILFNGYSEENYVIVVTYVSVIEDNLHKYVHSHNYTHKVTHTHIHTQPCYSCLPVMLQFQCNAHFPTLFVSNINLTMSMHYSILKPYVHSYEYQNLCSCN